MQCSSCAKIKDERTREMHMVNCSGEREFSPNVSVRFFHMKRAKSKASRKALKERGRNGAKPSSARHLQHCRMTSASGKVV